MTSDTFLVSDTHFGHANILVFTHENGTRVRPHWDTVDEMNEDMIQRWNKVVRPEDRVVHLGDVVINRRFLHLCERLNGRKELILGNHDIFPHEDFLKHFRRLHGTLKLHDLILSHFPVHPDSIAKWSLGNVHGHVHSQSLQDERYFNCSVEVIDYTPQPLELVRERLAKGDCPGLR